MEGRLKREIKEKRKFCKKKLILAAMLLLTACGTAGERTEQNFEETPGREEEITEMSTEIESAGAQSIWITYWGQDGAEEILAEAEEKFSKICLFGALFDEEGKPYIHQNTLELTERLQKEDSFELYLTFVNDWVLAEGSSLKDTELLYQLFSTESGAAAHAEAILDMTEEAGFDGIEIDYERIRSDMELWSCFRNFLEILIDGAEERGLSLRVLLEPGIPLEELFLPEGPEYVVMCYNLHGNGTGPGPKADEEFLISLADKFSTLPNVGYALANGGFFWDQEGNVESITTLEAASLAAANEVSPVRDEASGALYYTFQRDGETGTVWYADGETLKRWSEILRGRAGQETAVSIWRMNG